MRAIALRVWLLCLFAVAAAYGEPLHVRPGVRGTGPSGQVPDEVIVKFKAAVASTEADKVLGRHGAVTLRVRKAGDYRVVRIPPGKAPDAVAAELRKDSAVAYAEPNGIVRALMVPNDPYYVYQWHFRGPSGDINVEPAWDVQTGQPSVVVAIVDTGVAYENYGKTYRLAPDLAGTAFVPGYDFVNNDSHPNDDEGHGTHVAGTVAQTTNNSLGVAGAAFGCAIMPVKVLNKNGNGTVDSVAQGIRYAADHGASVINLSLGSKSGAETMRSAVQYAYERGVTICAAAGNDGGPTVIYPAAYDAYVIAVGATRYDETLSYYSSYGPSVDVVAPGGDVTVDQNGDGYGDGVLQQTFSQNPASFGYYFFQGTSMATPHVSAAAALLISQGAGGPDAVRQALQNTAKDLGAPGRDDVYGYGLINAAAALNYVAAPVHDVAISSMVAPGSALQGEMVEVLVTVTNVGDYAETFDVAVVESPDGTALPAQTVTALAPGAGQQLPFNWDTSAASLGNHTLTATAGPVAGETKLGDNSAQAVVLVHGTLVSMHVSAINMSVQRKGRSSNVAAGAVVFIVDESGSPVAGATVSGSWSGATTGSQTATTDQSGAAAFTSGSAKAGGTFTFSVTDVAKTGYQYDAASNVETSDSVTFP